MSQWTGITVEPYSLVFSEFNQAQYHTCEFCGAAAMHVVGRTSTFTDRRYTSFMCDTHADLWRPFVKPEGIDQALLNALYNGQ